MQNQEYSHKGIGNEALLFIKQGSCLLTTRPVVGL